MMAGKRDLNDISQRLADLGSRLDEKLRSPRADKAAREGLRVAETVLGNLHDLFTRGVTHEGLRDTIRREVRETIAFYTSQIDFAALRALPRIKRYPFTAWKLFTATAFRLSPPRRIGFAIAGIAFFVGCVQFLIGLSRPEAMSSGIFWWLVAMAIFVLLLLMELRDKLDLKSDLEIAREIQIGLVPSLPIQRESFDIRSHMRPANTVGGDYCDIVEIGDRAIGILIGDVAGKGIPAALLMALLQGSLRTLLTAGFRGSDLITKLNQHLCDSIPANRLVTLFYGELHTDSGKIQYINAGHNAPYLLRPRKPAERLEATSLVLGVLRDTRFEAGTVVLEPGDRLLLFTDGLSEAFNEKDEEYGEERLTAFLQGCAESDPDKFIAGAIREVLDFCYPKRPNDDITLMLVRRSS